MAQEQDFYGGTVANAIANACKDLSASQEELHIEVLETGSPGIFGLCRKKARIRVKRKDGRPPAAKIAAEAPEKVLPVEEPAPAQAETPQKKKRPPRERKKSSPPEPAAAEEQQTAAAPPPEPATPYLPPTAAALEAVQNDIARLLELMDCPSSVTVELEKQTVLCKISGEHQEALTGQDGRTLDSLQYLLRKMTAKLLPERTKLALEVGDYREQRMEALKEQVLELAAKVREDGMTQAVPALNPSERRMVHILLQEDKEVRSRSVGDGLFKKVLIYKPGKKKPYRKGGKGRKNDNSTTED
jgi:spoIIIJ-associated protein